MNQLYPIVRRVRRPLLVAESSPDGPPKPPVMVGNVESRSGGMAGLENIQQPTSNIEHPTEQPPASPAEDGNGKTSDEETSTQSDAG